jgi:hypothetical protein
MAEHPNSNKRQLHGLSQLADRNWHRELLGTAGAVVRR